MGGVANVAVAKGAGVRVGSGGTVAGGRTDATAKEGDGVISGFAGTQEANAASKISGIPSAVCLIFEGLLLD